MPHTRVIVQDGTQQDLQLQLRIADGQRQFLTPFQIGFFAAVQRSRESEISVSQLFFLTGEVAPRDVKVPMLVALSVQTVVGVAAAIARPTTDGKAGSVLAFGVLVPMLGLGLNGLWASRHGAFAPRSLPGDTADDTADDIAGDTAGDTAE